MITTNQIQRQSFGRKIFFKGNYYEIKYAIKGLEHKRQCKMVAETSDGEMAIVIDVLRTRLLTE